MRKPNFLERYFISVTSELTHTIILKFFHSKTELKKTADPNFQKDRLCQFRSHRDIRYIYNPLKNEQQEDAEYCRKFFFEKIRRYFDRN